MPSYQSIPHVFTHLTTGCTFVLPVAFLLVFDSVSAGQQDDTQVTLLPEISITAEKREADLERELSMVNTLSGEELDRAGIQDTQDLQYQVPGLVFSTTAGYGSPYLRGIGGAVSIFGDTGIATFIDGVYLGRANQSLQQLDDIERVEVRKGPYGVTQGHSVLGGAIKITTRDPEPYRSANTDFLYGNYNRHQLRGMLNTPLSDTGLSLRLSGTVNRRDGYSRNTFLKKDLDDQDEHAWRAKLRYRPSSQLDLVFSATQSKENDARNLASKLNSSIGVNGGVLLGGAVPDDPREVTDNVAEYQKIRQSIYSARLNWQTDALYLQALTAYQQTIQQYVADLDGTNIDFSSDASTSDSHAISQEFRLGSHQDERVDWAVGVYFRQEDGDHTLHVRLPVWAVSNSAESNFRNTSYSVFGALEYAFTPQWQGRAGLRYSNDEIAQNLVQAITQPSGNVLLNTTQKGHWNAVTPELGLSYTPTHYQVYYASMTRGYKPGGYNSLAIQPAFAPEYLWAYETGLKATFPERNLHLNAALFYYDYRDMQLLTLAPASAPGTLPIITNAGQATVRGIDLEAHYRPLPNLELTAGATFLDSRFERFDSIDPNNPTADPDRSGNPLPRAPDVSLLLAGTYRWVLSQGGEIKLSMDYRRQSEVYFNPYTDEAVRQGAYSLVNASLGFQDHKDHWYAELYVHNLADELYAQNIVRIDPAVGTARYWGAPRTFGFRLGYRF